MTKRVVKKSASKKPSKRKPSTMAKRVVPDALTSPEANAEVIDTGTDNSKGPAKKVAKVVQLILSVGDDDRDRNWDQFVADIKKALDAQEPPFADKNGERVPGLRATVSGGYYILDGKVCRPDDYDEKKQRFKKGATPPVWAGGPKQNSTKVSGIQFQMDYDLENLSSDEYDKKYGLGKYAPKVDKSKVITPAMQQKMMEDWKKEKMRKEEAELEEFEWDEDDLNDTEKLGKVADESASRAVARMKKSKGKRVVKKTTPKKPQKKVVRKVKK